MASGNEGGGTPLLSLGSAIRTAPSCPSKVIPSYSGRIAWVTRYLPLGKMTMEGRDCAAILMARWIAGPSSVMPLPRAPQDFTLTAAANTEDALQHRRRSGVILLRAQAVSAPHFCVCALALTLIFLFHFHINGGEVFVVVLLVGVFALDPDQVAARIGELQPQCAGGRRVRLEVHDEAVVHDARRACRVGDGLLAGLRLFHHEEVDGHLFHSAVGEGILHLPGDMHVLANLRLHDRAWVDAPERGRGIRTRFALGVGRFHTQYAVEVLGSGRA